MNELKRLGLVLSLFVLPVAVAGCGGGAPGSPATAAAPAPSPSPSPSPAPASSSDLTVTSPTAGASVASPFPVVASSTTCSSESVASMAYALDFAVDTVITGTSINVKVTASSGAHTLHVKAWGSSGVECQNDLAITVTVGPSAPSTAISVANIQALTGWQSNHDPATGGSSSGATSLVSSPSLDGPTREFDTSFTNSGGEVYHVTFGSDPTPTNFLYDAWIYLTTSASAIANLEMDMNQVVANGDAIIYGFQCDGYSGTWDYTKNGGSPSSPSDQWVHASAPCDVRNWKQNAWHHVQIAYSRDSSGNVTYHSVWLDGVETPINATVPSAYSLGWTSVLVTNFQIDGLGSRSNTTYLGALTISRW